MKHPDPNVLSGPPAVSEASDLDLGQPAGERRHGRGPNAGLEELADVVEGETRVDDDEVRTAWAGVVPECDDQYEVSAIDTSVSQRLDRNDRTTRTLGCGSRERLGKTSS